MEEDMMMPNVAPAPMMDGTPMGGDLSEPMAPAQAELDPAEMQEAQGALMQIIQIIQMLINQGMSEEEIQQFLAQYGITEEELDQAAAILGVDIDALMAGEERMPMAQGMSADLQKFMAQVASRPQRQQQSMTDPLAPAPVPKTPEMVMFSINSDINNLMQEYNMAVRNNEFERAQAIADQIDGLQQQIINLQESRVPPMPVAGLNMRFGGSATGK
jgi:DNA-binding transcriptional MerR regulator